MLNPTHVMVDSKYGNKFYEDTEGAKFFLENRCEFSHMEWPAFTFLGGYEIHYYAECGDVLCYQCVNENLNLTLDVVEGTNDPWCLAASGINYEDPDMHCDHCGRKIHPAYGD